MLTGKHLIAGKFCESEKYFEVRAGQNEKIKIFEASSDQIDLAVTKAEEAFLIYSKTSRATRAKFLRDIGSELDAIGNELTKAGMIETNLDKARLDGERGRTIGQLAMFADLIEKGAYIEIAEDDALPDRKPLPRPNLKRINLPVGPIAVFGASNFPLAFSSAGGDTASALAAGCCVVVKAHSAHPLVCGLVAQAILKAITKNNLPEGIFSQLQGNNHEIGQQLIKHPLINAVGFTGSLRGGRALYDICCSRDVPIPFYGELGSINPIIILDKKFANNYSELAKNWAGSLTMGVGQFCTNPGILFVKDNSKVDDFISQTVNGLKPFPKTMMLTNGISQSYCSGSKEISKVPGITSHLTCDDMTNKECGSAGVTASLYSIDYQSYAKNHSKLNEEVFGPCGLVVRYKDDKELFAALKLMPGQLTFTLQMNQEDKAFAKKLIPIIERKAGRLIINGFPTGVEVCQTMVHSGPYPASTNFGATSVGTLAIARFLRPVCYQNFDNDLMPAAFKA